MKKPTRLAIGVEGGFSTGEEKVSECQSGEYQGLTSYTLLNHVQYNLWATSIVSMGQQKAMHVYSGVVCHLTEKVKQ